MLNILCYIIFSENAVFSEETANNCSEGTLNLREKGLLRQKINITCFIAI